MQTDQCTVLRFQDSFIFHSKNVRLNYTDFYYVFFCEKVITFTNVHNQSRHYAVPVHTYIHTDEQTAVAGIADDKISTIYLTRHQYFSYLKLFAAKCQ